jgi:hypothetical protein
MSHIVCDIIIPFVVYCILAYSVIVMTMQIKAIIKKWMKIKQYIQQLPVEEVLLGYVDYAAEGEEYSREGEWWTIVRFLSSLSVNTPRLNFVYFAHDTPTLLGWCVKHKQKSLYPAAPNMIIDIHNQHKRRSTSVVAEDVMLCIDRYAQVNNAPRSWFFARFVRQKQSSVLPRSLAVSPTCKSLEDSQ